MGDDIEFGSDENGIEEVGFGFGFDEIDDTNKTSDSFNNNEIFVQNEQYEQVKKPISEDSSSSDNLIPTIQSLPEYKSLIEILDKNIHKKVIKDPVPIHFDFNKMDPVAAEAEANRVANMAKLNAAVYNYIVGNDFSAVDKTNLLSTEIFSKLKSDESFTIIEKAINELGKNDFCIKDDEFLKKLYKLKPIEELVQDSIQVDQVYQRQEIIRNNVIQLINKFCQSMQVVQKEQKSLIDNSLSTNQIEEKNKQIEELKDKLENTIDRETYQEKVDEITNLENEIENLKLNLSDAQKLLTTNKEFPEETNFKEQIIKIFPNFDINEDVELFLGNLSSKITSNEKLIDELKDKLANTIDQELYQEKVDEITSLENEIENLKLTIEDLTRNTTTNDKLSLNDSVNQTEEIDITPTKDETKPKNKLKLLGFIFGGIFLLIVAFFSIGAFLLNNDEPTNNQTNYAAPLPKKIDTPVEPVKKVENNIQQEQVYDFNKELTFEEFKMQKFDIYTENFEKIRMNKKDFFRGDIVNGFKLVKSNSDGKILFVDKDSNPVWIEMR